MIKPLLDFARRHIILFGTAKFAAALTVGDYPAVLIWYEAFGEFIAPAELN